MRHFGLPLDEAPRRVHDRASHIRPPWAAATVAISASRLALCRSLGVHLLSIRIIDNGDGVTVRPLHNAVDPARQLEAVLRVVRNVRHLGLTREIDSEQIVRAAELDPGTATSRCRGACRLRWRRLREGRSRLKQEQRRRDEWNQTHDSSSPLKGTEFLGW